MSGHTQHLPVQPSNLLDKCPMTSTNLQACFYSFGVILDFLRGDFFIILTPPSPLHYLFFQKLKFERKEWNEINP